MRTKRNLFTFALGGVLGYLVGRYPTETYDKVRGGAAMTVGLARERLPFPGAGGHRAPTAQPPETGDDVIDRTSTAYVARPHP